MRRLLILIVVLFALGAYLVVYFGAIDAPVDKGVQADPVVELPRKETQETLVPPMDESLERTSVTASEEEDEEEVLPDEETARFPGPDPVETGECALVMSFYDAATGEAVSGNVDLWRIGAPGNESWSAGDQKQVSLPATDGVARAEDLPAGNYRAFPLFARAGSTVAPAFAVAGELTSVSIPVEMPKSVPTHLWLVNGQGQPIADSPGQRVEYMDRGYQKVFGGRDPEWLTKRMPKDSNAILIVGYGGGSSGSYRRDWKPVESGGNGIPLGEIRQDTYEWSRSYRCGIRVNGVMRVTVYLNPSGIESYVAVVPDRSLIHEHLQFPADARRFEVLPDLWLNVKAAPIDTSLGQTVESQWTQSVVEVDLTVDEFEPVRVPWTPGQEPMPFIPLVSKPPQ
ncbi:MAG: hypothetical protein KDB61_01595 [Planctomycetes bacterium]|nr:hypothetical protein [Planctomycetota bacterium]